MENQQVKPPRAPTFLGAFLYIFAGMLFLGVGVGMRIIGAPIYYPGAVWALVNISYITVGAIILGLGYRNLRRFLRYVDSQRYLDSEELSDNTIDIGNEETLAEKRP